MLMGCWKKQAREEAREWFTNPVILQDGSPVTPYVTTIESVRTGRDACVVAWAREDDRCRYLVGARNTETCLLLGSTVTFTHTHQRVTAWDRRAGISAISRA